MAIDFASLKSFVTRQNLMGFAEFASPKHAEQSGHAKIGSSKRGAPEKDPPVKLATSKRGFKLSSSKRGIKANR